MNNSNVSVYSLMGTPLTNIQNNNSSDLNIDFSDYSNGVYFVHIKTDAGTAVRKIVVSK
ncbi:MAG: T9SS type A sorting domain-containing protein [Bacteroidetes bacterium]|nr:MAG: T9SS type A sorting domain-containing protein [Bacteroidota bacterium]